MQWPVRLVKGPWAAHRKTLKRYKHKAHFKKVIDRQVFRAGFLPHWKQHRVYWTLDDGTECEGMPVTARFEELDYLHRRGKPRTFAWFVPFVRAKQRHHPTFWFFLFPCAVNGGVVVIPDAVINANWHGARLIQDSYWMWRYWERWDCLATWPDLPADLVDD